MRRSRAAAFAAALSLGIGVTGVACKSGDSDKTAATTTTRRPTTTTAGGPAHPAPLTGLEEDEAARGRPALVVKIDNAPKARPQYGLASADIVVEEGVEGGITRFAAIFQSHDADVLGPVRSARSSDLHIATPLDHPLFAYSGTNSNFQKLIDQSSLVNVGVNKQPAAYHRDSRDGRNPPYNLFSSTPLLFRAAPAGAPVAKKLVDVGGGTADGTSVTKLDVHWFDKVRTDVTWNWDGSHWSRIQNGTPTIDGNGPAIAPRNIVTLFVNYEDTGERDQSNSVVPEAKLTGSGEAWVVRDGTLTKGQWHKADDNAPIELTDANGKRISLIAGQTWIELPQPGNASVA